MSCWTMIPVTISAQVGALTRSMKGPLKRGLSCDAPQKCSAKRRRVPAVRVHGGARKDAQHCTHVDGALEGLWQIALPRPAAQVAEKNVDRWLTPVKQTVQRTSGHMPACTTRDGAPLAECFSAQQPAARAARPGCACCRHSSPSPECCQVLLAAPSPCQRLMHLCMRTYLWMSQGRKQAACTETEPKAQRRQVQIRERKGRTYSRGQNACRTRRLSRSAVDAVRFAAARGVEPPTCCVISRTCTVFHIHAATPSTAVLTKQLHVLLMC